MEFLYKNTVSYLYMMSSEWHILHKIIFFSETTFTPEELVAMLLQQARKDAEAYAGQPVTEVVLTVPAYFGQAARRSVLSAAHLAGLKPLQLINDYMAGE